MCDTFVAMPDVTTDGHVIFGKNSDRPFGEIQDVVVEPAGGYLQGAALKCTYVTIPQTAKTFAVVLSKPRWIWGAEMGANELGVVIGNEAVWTTEPIRDSGLLGMDLVRLGLERGSTSTEALDIIVDLLGEFGQGGNCAQHHEMNYHNSFLIADPNVAWVLETAGDQWVAEQIIHGTRSISNGLSIRSRGDRRHPDLDPSIEDFAGHFSVGNPEDALLPNSRAGRVRHLCSVDPGTFDVGTAKSILRDHQGSICMHGAFETRGSQVSSISPTTARHWFIESPFPCQQRYREQVIPSATSSSRKVDSVVQDP